MTPTPTLPTFILMPGLEGTAKLYEPLEKAMLANEVVSYRIVYPTDWDDPTLDQTVDVVADQMQGVLSQSEGKPTRNFVLLAESFSGPIAVALAARKPPGLVGVILVATFLRQPRPVLTRITPFFKPILAKTRLTPFSIRRYLVGGNADPVLIELVQNVLREAPIDGVVGRARLLSAIDVREQAGGLDVQVLYLQGGADRVVGARHGVDVQKHIKPDLLTFHRIDGGPHLLTQAKPEESWHLILDWLSQNRLTASQ